MINIIKYRSRSGFPMFHLKIVYYPSDEMILKRPFDDLMEEIWGKHLVDVCAREVTGEWLLKQSLA